MEIAKLWKKTSKFLSSDLEDILFFSFFPIRKITCFFPNRKKLYILRIYKRVSVSTSTRGSSCAIAYAQQLLPLSLTTREGKPF